MEDEITKGISVSIRFYEELNDFLKSYPPKTDLSLVFQHRRSVKDLIESLGVPHVEVDLILVNGNTVDFDYIVRNGDRISVYPVFEAMELAGVTRLRDKGLREVRFELDGHLGKLARNLRLLGFDTDYDRHRADGELALIAEKEGRILLTRDLQLLKRRQVTHGLYVRSTMHQIQTVEILDRLQLWERMVPFSRCLACNGLIETVSSVTAVEHRIPPRVQAWCGEFTQCTRCGRVFWKGSHYDRLTALVGQILSAKGSTGEDKHD